MADNPGGVHIQGVSDEGNPVEDGYPVVIAFEDASGNKEVPTLAADGSVPVTVNSAPPVTGTVTANQGSPNAGGAASWPVTDTAAETVLGVVGDVAVTDDNPGTISAKLRGLNKILTDVWDSANHWLRVGAAQVGSWVVTANQGTPAAIAIANAWPVTQPDRTVTGTITANGQTVAINTVGMATVGFALLGGTINFVVEVTEDGSTWDAVPYANLASGVVQLGTATSPFRGYAPTGGAQQMRVRATGFTSNTNVTLEASPAYHSLMDMFNSILGEPGGSGNVQNTGSHVYVCTSKAGAGALWSYLRSPSIFKTAQATAAGSTALWTPTAGTKFRLMRYALYVTDNATQAVAGTLTVSLLDAAGAIAQAHDIFVPSVALLNSGSLYSSGWIDLGNGIVSSTNNNVLNVNLSAALTAGNVRVIACGTEE